MDIFWNDFITINVLSADMVEPDDVGEIYFVDIAEENIKCMELLAWKKL